MLRQTLIAALVTITLAACATTPPQLGPDGLAIPEVYPIKASDEGRITYALLDSANELRRSAGIAPLALNAQLTAAAATHSRDMAVQNRPWHFGSDGSSPLERVRRTGYPGMMLGEDISETYENEIDTLTAWMQIPDTRAVILDPAATNAGFSWYQEKNGKIWWTLVTGN